MKTDSHHFKAVGLLVTNTVKTMLKSESVIDWAKVDLDKFNPEFRHRWMSEVSNISDETLQDLFARLLKGELESPGSVSNDTMSIARDMSKSRAEEFQILCSAALYDTNGTPKVVVGCGSPGGDSLRPYGLSFDVLMRLAHHRLIVNDVNSRLELKRRPETNFLRYPSRSGSVVGIVNRNLIPPYKWHFVHTRR